MLFPECRLSSRDPEKRPCRLVKQGDEEASRQIMNVVCTLAMFRTVFVITDQVPSLRSVTVPLAFLIAIFALLLLALIRLRGSRLRIAAAIVLLIALMVCSINFMIGALHWLSYSDRADEYASAIRQYQGGDYKTAEGIVSEIEYTRDRGLCFLAGSAQICTTAPIRGVGYQRNGALPFRLEDGMKVRVFYHDGTILRIDLIEE